MTLHTVTGSLTPHAPFDFGQSLRFLENFNALPASQSIAAVAGRPTLSKALSFSGHAVLARVWSVGTVEAPALACRFISAEPLDAAAEAAAVDRLRFYLSLDDDLAPFYAIGRDDPVMAPVIKELYGYHQVKFTTPFENACWAVLSQRNQWPSSRRMLNALAEAYGARLTVDGQDYLAFPEPELVAVVAPEALAEVIRHKPKGTCIGGVAHAFAGVDEAFLRTAAYAEVEAWLLGVRCLGPWSAGFILLRGLGRVEGLPSGETRMVMAAAKRYGAEGVAAMTARYAPYQGYWAHYLRVADG